MLEELGFCLLLSEEERGHFFWGFACFWGKKQSRRTRFRGVQIKHLPASAGVRNAGAREDSKNRWGGTAGLVKSAGGLKEEVDMSRSEVESMYYVLVSLWN